MPFDRLKMAGVRTVGTKQTTRAVETGKARVVYVARDADERVTARLVRLCSDLGVEVVWIDDMASLGKACGIEVGTASAAVLEEDASAG